MITFLHTLSVQIGSNLSGFFVNLFPCVLAQLSTTQGLDKRNRVTMLLEPLLQRLQRIHYTGFII
ncbi:hypothetical protein A15D_03331 [Alcanivorax sp. MD8A]|nr:hypothetical protein A15D_03331 [Alcanivorax sp. MD8A]